MAHALRAIDHGIVLCDESGEMAFRNAQAEVFLGARYGDAVVESSIEELATRALAGHDATRTLELFGPPRRTLVLSADPLDDGHRSIGALVVIEDVTERRRIDAVRRDFVANISHELKTPVGGLGLLAETIADEDDLDGRPPPRAAHAPRGDPRQPHHRRPARAVAASRPTRRPSSEPVAVHLVLAEAVERAASAAEHRGIDLDLQEPSHRLAVRGDRRQLVSAVYNLLDNAIKYSEPGSAVRVRASVHDGRRPA